MEKIGQIPRDCTREKGVTELVTCPQYVPQVKTRKKIRLKIVTTFRSHNTQQQYKFKKSQNLGCGLQI